MLLSNTFKNIGRILTGPYFSYMSFLPFMCKGITVAVLKQDRNEYDLKELPIIVHKKSAKIFKLSLIILMGISKS